MKKILSYIIMGILGVTVFTACSDDESYPTPTALDASTLSYEAKAGAVKLKWKIPENANYKYIKVTYTLRKVVRSVYVWLVYIVIRYWWIIY